MRFLSVVNVLLMMVFIDFMCSMNAVVVCYECDVAIIL